MSVDTTRAIHLAIPSVTSRLHGGSAGILGICRMARDAPLVIESKHLRLYQYRGTDIPWIVGQGWADFGLCGLDAVIETKAEVSVLQRFPETTTRIALIGRADGAFPNYESCLSIVTEYPEITRTTLQARYQNLQVWKAHGACESFAFLDTIDGVVD